MGASVARLNQMAHFKAIFNWIGRFSCLGLLFCQLSPPSLVAYDAPASSLHPRFTPLAQEQLKEAQKQYEADTNSLTKACQLGYAYFFAGEFATNKTYQSELAQHGIDICQRAVALNRNSAEAHYYHALNLGQMARTKLLAALSLVGKMRPALEYASAAKPKLDHAGPDRCLGLLYRDAPGWPISIGNKTKARKHLTRAFAIAPEYPGNVIVQLETSIRWRDYKMIAKYFAIAKPILESARKKLTGKKWEPFWDDWDRRWKEIQQRANKMLPRK